ncbi:MAG: hypothetical protein KKF62_14870 [Bacteroidetes bacterium]|nr:hypothetical protein [Bacteroidota bacterium]MBU1113977.1 hypothetical protein [Bacteroidota bacterium]MBU1800269.1 hypothetical protein [Bacteroidota bacterium]
MDIFRKIPHNLYRGDSDSRNERKLKQTINQNCLLTNLSNSGSGREIFSNPLKNLVSKHISPGWSKTHFLSFSESKKISIKYGSRQNNNCILTNLDDWDFVVIVFSKEFIIKETIRETDEGCFILEFCTASLEFHPVYKLLAINVYIYLCSKNADNNLKEKAKLDKEWLLLPLNRFENEYTSKLDMCCISSVEKYKSIY